MNCTFQQKENLWEILASSKDIEQQILRDIIEMFRKEKIQDCLGYLQNSENENHYQQYTLQVENLAHFDKEQKLNFVRKNIKKINQVITKIKDHYFNYMDFSNDENFILLHELINRIKNEKQIIEFLKFLVLFTAIDNTLIQCGSNSLYLLVEMKADLKYQNFENIKILNTSLRGANFARQQK